jgi:site-specific DNA-methyltransferase (adenine-specific)
VSHLTLNFIIREWTQHDIEWLNVLSAASPFIVASKKLKSTLELIAVERAISRTSNPGLIDTKTTNEPAVLARKPLCGTVADNVMTWGVGALNIDGTRIGGGGQLKWSAPRDMGYHRGTYAEKYEATESTSGRWPANVILDEDAAKALDEQSGSNVSRFFYIAKASRAEREAGLDAPDGQRANIHTTVKPLALMRHLVRLVTPKGGKVLDPFMGSGSTGCAAVLEGMGFVGIDITPEYVAIAQKRIDHYAVTSPLEGK